MHVRMRATERGAGTLEYLGAVVVVVLLLGGILAASSTSFGPRLAATYDRAICAVSSQLPGSGGCEGRGDPADFGAPDFTPNSCTVSTQGTNHKVEGSIAIIDLGGSHGVQIAEIRHEDGTVTYRVAQTGEIEGGVGVGIGGKGETGEDNPGGKLSGDLGISGSYTGGPTYEVSSLEEAKAIQDKLISNPWADVGHQPVSETTTWGGEIEGSIDLGIDLGEKKGEGEGQPGPGDGTDPGNLGLGGSLTGGHHFSTTVHDDGSTTYTTTWSGEIKGEGSASAAGSASGSWKGTTSVVVTRDANGQITSIQFETASKAGSNLKLGDKELAVAGNQNHDTVTTATLEVNDSNRAAVEQWMGDPGSNYMGFKPLESMFWDPTKPSNDPMIDALFNQAQITQVTMDNYEDSYSVGGEIKWGLKLGATYTYTDSQGQVIDAQYAGAPEGGRRPWQHMEVCFP